MNWTAISEFALAIFGFLTLVVKWFPTLNKGWLLEIIKFLGNLTNRQTDDAAIRAQRESTP